MKAEDVAWLMLLLIAAASFGGLCLLGGCDVYHVPCEEGYAGRPGVTVQLYDLDGGE